MRRLALALALALVASGCMEEALATSRPGPIRKRTNKAVTVAASAGTPGTKAWEFDGGANDHVNLPPAWASTGSITRLSAACWVKDTADASAAVVWTVTCNGCNQAAVHGFGIVLDPGGDSNDVRAFFNTDGDLQTTTNTGYSDGVWNLIALTWDGAATESKLYTLRVGTDSALTLRDTDTTAPASIDFTSSPGSKFGERQDGSLVFDGRLFECGAWDDVLNTTELAELHDSGTATDWSLVSFVGNEKARWEFGDDALDDPTDTTDGLRDQSGNGHHGDPAGGFVAGDEVTDGP